MTIGIDLDDTLIDTKETANKYLKEFIKDESLKDYHRSLTLVVFANMDSALLQ